MRRRLLRWLSWFAVTNAALLAIVGLRYPWYYATLGPLAAWGYALAFYAGHMSALAYIPLVLLLAQVIALIPRPRIVVPAAVVLASAIFSLFYGIRGTYFDAFASSTRPPVVMDFYR